MKLVEPEMRRDGDLARRDLMKIGAGAAVMTTVGGRAAIAQEEAQGGRGRGGGASRPAGLGVMETGAGYKNDANRISGNGPMDDTTQQIVSYVTSFSESSFRDNLARVNTIMLDTLVAHMAGFEGEPARICARMGRRRQASDQKSTIMGYGITTNPESAAWANSSMVRHTDYNDSGSPGGHASSIIPGILAVGEAFHSTGLEVLVAVGLGYEILVGLSRAGNIGGGGGGGGGGAWDGPYDGLATAMACGKLMKLNEDKLANALSLALVPHLPMFVSHVGALSHWKGCHEPMAVMCGVYAALLANEGMTGPAQPFEERGGWFDHNGAFRELRLPASPDGHLGIEHFRLKEFPAEGSTQGVIELFPSIREWTKVDEIAAIQVDVGSLYETADPPKWDPRNRETADHSLPYIIAVGVTDGEIYLDSFKPERYLHDASIRELMAKITIRPTDEPRGTPSIDGSTASDNWQRLTIRKKSGEVLVKESRGYHNPTHDEVIAKFKRICGYRSVSNEQRDRALATWPNLRTVKDIGEPIRDLANYGKPIPL